jgi:hypothetical protein
VFEEYMYIVVTKNENNTNKYQLVRDINIPFIFKKDKMPIYIKYLLFNSCPYVFNKELDKSGFGDLANEIQSFYTNRKTNLQTNTNIERDIANIEKKLKKYKKKYSELKSIKDKSLEQRSQQSLYKEEIKDLQQRIDMLYSQRNINENMTGGAQQLKPSEQYNSYVSQYNPLGYPMNINRQMSAPMQMPNNNIVYLPNQGYPYQPSYYTKKNNFNYNQIQNKEKEQKSKLSFYITIELELFPGKTANMLQQSVTKCQSSFERIRESWADIFGFDYRPSPMNEAYAYNFEKTDNNDKRDETDETNETNETNYKDKRTNRTEKNRLSNKNNKTRKYNKY